MIREATLSDIDALLELARYFVPLTGAASLSERRFRPELCKIIKSEHMLALVAEHEGKVVGCLLGQIGRVWYSEDCYATDIGFVVLPDYSGIYAWLMAKKFVRWAKEQPKVVEVTMQISSGLGDTDRTGKMYESIGLKKMGGCYTVAVNARAEQ